MASLASPPFYKKYPLETLDVGYIGMKNILELCKFYNDKNLKLNKTCKLLYASTSEVYGDAKEHPQNENYYGNVNSYGARSCYDCSKRIGETLIYTYNELYNLDTRIVRIFNTYGPYMNLNDGRIVTEIIKSKLLNSELNVYGDGTQTRSLSYVDNTLNLMMIVMQSDYKGPVNVGDDVEISVNELIDIIKDLKTHSELNIKYTEMEKDDPKVRRPDLSLVKTLIEKNKSTYNKVSLKEGLFKTLNYFEKELNFEN
jgi:nucleoside-diphosphate-sugar epimerase